MAGLKADDVIELLDLVPLPGEGGMINEFWQSPHGSAIYYLLHDGEVSAMHRLAAPELWHFYAGAALQLVLLDADGGVRRPVVGTDLRGGQRPLVVVDAGVWMGAYSLGDWTLVGTTMAPPYDGDGFELGDRRQLLAEYPSAAADITRLTCE